MAKSSIVDKDATAWLEVIASTTGETAFQAIKGPLYISTAVTPPPGDLTDGHRLNVWESVVVGSGFKVSIFPETGNDAQVQYEVIG